MELLGHTGTVESSARLFSEVAAPFAFCARALISPRFPHHELLADFCILRVLGGTSYLIMVLICSSLTANCVKECLCMCSLVICVSSLEKRQFRVFVHFLLNCLFIIELWVLYIFWIQAPYQIYDWQICFLILWETFFSLSWWCIFNTKDFLFNFDAVRLLCFFFLLLCVLLVFYLRIICQLQGCEDLLLGFLLRSSWLYLLRLGLWPTLSSSGWVVWDRDSASLFGMGTAHCPSAFVAKAVLSPRVVSTLL